MVLSRSGCPPPKRRWPAKHHPLTRTRQRPKKRFATSSRGRTCTARRTSRSEERRVGKEKRFATSSRGRTCTARRTSRSEERRVGKDGRQRRPPWREKEKRQRTRREE